MNTNIINYLKEILRDYPQIDHYLAQRTQELLYPYQEHSEQNLLADQKIEGVAMLAITIATDRRLHQLEINKAAIEYCLERTDDLTKDIIHDLYFTDHPSLTLEGLALKLSADHTTISRHRKRFFIELATQLGLI